MSSIRQDAEERQDYPDANRDEILCALKVFTDEGQLIELRAVKVDGTHTETSLHTDWDTLADEAMRLAPRAKGVYITLNPADPDKLKSGSARDEHIARRRWLLVDVDPARPEDMKHCSSTNDEHEKALQRADEIRAYLRFLGWSEPVTIDSGNGAHLLYRVDLPNDDNGLIQRVLQSLDFLFSGDGQGVDVSVYNPSRITKLPGTLARKGENTPERPHRMARLLYVPSEVGVITREQLEALASMMPRQEEATKEPKGFTLEGFLKKHGITTSPVKDTGYAKVRNLAQCPWSDEHSDGADGAAVFEFPSGAVDFRCHHEHCQERRWRDFRKHYEPEYRESSPETETMRPKRKPYRLVTYDGNELMEKDIPERRWLVHGLIPEGVTFFGGRPKAGKSFLALNVALAVAAGGIALGEMKTEPCSVLYLMLEDDEIGLRERVEELRQLDADALSRFHYAMECCRLDDGGIEGIEAFLDEHSDVGLIVIDPYVKVKAKGRGRGRDAYVNDYAANDLLMKMAHKRHVGVLCITHTTKTRWENVVDDIQGSTGMTASVDHILGLYRDDGATRAEIKIRSRVMRDASLHLETQGVMDWRLTEAPPKSLRLSPRDQEIIDFVDARGPMPFVELRRQFPDGTRNAFDQRLIKLVKKGALVRTDDQKYASSSSTGGEEESKREVREVRSKTGKKVREEEESVLPSYQSYH